MSALIVIVALAGVVPTYTKTSDPVLSKDESHFSQRFSRGKETIRVDIWRKSFRAANHRIKEDRGLVTVDGRVPLGTDGFVPEAITTEISRVRIGWGATTMDLSRELFQDCFNASMEGIRVAPSEDFRSVLVMISGGDGAGAYQAHVIHTVVGTEIDGHVPAFLRDGRSYRGQVRPRVRPRCLKSYEVLR